MRDDSQIVNKGAELVAEAKERATGYERRNENYYDSRKYVIGRESALDSQHWYHNAIVHNRHYYQNVAIDLAIQFAIENNDRKLLKVLERMKKNGEESFKHFYEAYDLAFQNTMNAKARAERIKKLEEDLIFLAKYNTDDIHTIREEKYERREKLKTAHGKEKEKLEREIRLLEELSRLKRSKREKIVVIKQKEIREIKERAQKPSIYRKRYAKLLRKAYKYRQKTHGYGLGDLHDKAHDIIFNLGRSVHIEYFEGRWHTDNHYLSQPKVHIDEYYLAKTKEELVEKYYPNKKGKTL